MPHFYVTSSRNTVMLTWSYDNVKKFIIIKKRLSYQTVRQPLVQIIPLKQKNIPYLECLSNKNVEPDSLHLPYILMRLSTIYFAEIIITPNLLFVKFNATIHYKFKAISRLSEKSKISLLHRVFNHIPIVSLLS